MLKELKNIRSYNDLLKVLNKIATDINTDGLKLDKIANVLTSQSSDEDVITIGKGTVNIPTKTTKPSANVKKSPTDTTIVHTIETVPDDSVLKMLVSNANSINKMYQNIDNLRMTQHIARTRFNTMNSIDDFLTSSDKLILEAQTKIKQSFDALTKIAITHAPKKLQSLAKSVQEFFEAKASDLYSSRSKTIQVVPVKTDKRITTLLYAITLNYKDFKLSPDKSIGSKGFAYREFCIVITASVDVDSGKTTYHITAKPEFSLPGTYNPGVTIKSEKSANEILAKIVSYYNFNLFSDRKPMVDSTENRATFSKIKGVQRIRIVRDALSVLLVAGENESLKRDVMAKIFTALRSIYGNDIVVSYSDARKIKLLNKKADKYEYHTVLHFTLSVNKDSNVSNKLLKANTEKLRRLKEELGLSDSDMSELKKLIWK